MDEKQLIKTILPVLAPSAIEAASGGGAQVLRIFARRSAHLCGRIPEFPTALVRRFDLPGPYELQVFGPVMDRGGALAADLSNLMTDLGVGKVRSAGARVGPEVL